MKKQKVPRVSYKVEERRKNASDLQAKADTGWWNGLRIVRSISCYMRFIFIRSMCSDGIYLQCERPSWQSSLETKWRLFREDQELLIER
jgi:hypothetical protein